MLYDPAIILDGQLIRLFSQTVNINSDCRTIPSWEWNNADFNFL